MQPDGESVDCPAVFVYRERRITCLWHTSKREVTT